MTEGEWLACDDWMSMLRFLRGEIGPVVGERDTRARLISHKGNLVEGEGIPAADRLRYFALACCDGWRSVPLDQVNIEVLASYRRFLNREITREEHLIACRSANTAADPVLLSGFKTFGWSPTPFGVANQIQDVAWVTACHQHRDRIAELEQTATDDERFAWGFFGYDFPEFGATAQEVYEPLPGLLREILGNPYRQIAFDLDWRTSDVLLLACGIYDERAFERMPILADALQDAGCDSADILNHLRDTSATHVRGCWALDLVLGKE